MASRADIQRAFQNSLGRPASQAEEDSYFAVSNGNPPALTDAQVYTTISNSAEADLVSDPVIRFYQAVFGRVPDAAGLDNTQDYIRAFGASAQTYITLAEQFTQTPEFTNRFGTGTTVDAAYVQALYVQILGRQGTPEEIAGYTSGANGYTTRGGVLYAISQSGEAINISNDAVNGFLLNAAEGDAVYTGSLYTPANGLPNQPGATIIPLETISDNLTGGSNSEIFVGTFANGQNSTLQSGDTVNGGGGSDTLRIIATNNNNTQNVVPNLTSVETIEYQGFNANPNNTLNLANSGGVQNVSLVNGNSGLTVTNLGTTVAASASNTTGGFIQLNYNAATVAGLTDAQAVTFNNASQNAGDNATFIGGNGIEIFNITATGTNGTLGDAGGGGTNAVGVFGNSVTTVNVSGAGSINLNAAPFAAAVTTFNASQNSGGVDATFTAGGNVTATGGSAADTFRFGNGLNASDVVNGGTNTNGLDTVRVTTQGDLSLAAAAQPFNNLTGIERVAFDGNGVILNGATFTNTGITNILFNTDGGGANGNDTINNAGSARTYEFGENNTGSATFALNATSTALKIDLLGTLGTAAANDGNDADVNGITIQTAGAGFNTTPVAVTLTSQGDLADGFFTAVNAAVAGNGGNANFVDGQVNQTGAITVANGSTFTVTGAGNLAIFGGNQGNVAAGFTNNVTLDESGLTGNSILVGSNFTGDTGTVAQPAPANPVVTGVNTATTQTGADTFTLGSGTDVVVFTSGAASGTAQIATPANGTTAANAAFNGNVFTDTINNFTAGANGDVLARGTNLNQINTGNPDNYTAIQTTTQTAINALSGQQNTLLEAANRAANDAAAKWTAFSYGGETYALYDADNATANYQSGTDTLVKLTGVTIANLTDANFSIPA